MTTITESIKTDVPIAYADKQWTAYMFSHLSRAYAQPGQDASQVTQRIDADSCTVTFTDESDATTRVSVSVACQVADESARVHEDLRRDLEQYREFLTMRCEKDDCRTC
jgi:hypothetical protein